MRLLLNKILLFFLLLLISNLANAQRIVYGIRMSLLSKNYSQMDNIYVIPSPSYSTYSVRVVKESQSGWTGLSFYLPMGIEFRKWFFSFEPGLLKTNFSYKYYYLKGNGGSSEEAEYTITETHWNFPLYASYAIYQPRKRNYALSLEAGGAYSPVSTKKIYNIYHQNTYLWGSVGLTYTYKHSGGVTLRYQRLLNVSNVAKANLGMVELVANVYTPNIKTQKRKLYEN